MYRFAGVLLALMILLPNAPARAEDKTLVVFAATSMKNALDDIDAAFTAKTGTKVSASYAGSLTLAKQIEHGVPADIFVSDDPDCMKYAVTKKVIDEATKVNLLGNSLVLIAPKAAEIDRVTIGPGFDLAKLAGDGKIATGDVKSVAKYAKAALEKLGAWQAAEPKFVTAESERAALALVARGKAVLGIVYSTDATVGPGVRIVDTFPADSHPPIIYSVAATAIAKPEAKAYLDYLRSPAAKDVFERYGFLTTAALAQSPYAGMQTRPIKALSERQVAELKTGHGMGLALAAELNGYPGPAHVLELSDKLGLSAEQKARIQTLLDSMNAEALRLGAKLLDQEAALDQQFAGRSITPESLKAATEQIGMTQAELRETHLKYHLQTTDILTPDQIRQYSILRGYGSDGATQHHHDMQ